MNKIFVFFLWMTISHLLFADPPKPPLGKRWVMNPDFSDEFNGTVLDTTRWLDHHPTWRGRAPGLFMPSQISVKDGFLQIKGERMLRDTVIHAYGKDISFYIKGGAVVSKKSVFLGYYECRVKAAATTMSTTFWFSSTKSFKGPNGCDKYGLEWDIQECIGRRGDFNGSYFAHGMHSNSHYWYTDCKEEKHDYRAPQVKFEDRQLASDDFHVYGGWWHDETMASYYYDNGAPKYQKFYHKISDKPFDQPMFMRLVCETYPFPWIELPTDEELADPTKNVVYYDWVRGYKLVDVKDPHMSQVAPETEIGLYYEDIEFESASMELPQGNVLKIPFCYKANENRDIHFVLKDAEGKKVASAKYKAYTGYANLIVDLKVDVQLAAETEYTLWADIRPENGTKTDILNSSVLMIELVENGAL
ncbi:LamG domain-containing protein [Saccharicrinis fermentans]|uniref:Extracellular agarase n=1 Tax=Saccharicrinis fermentans DSM 9555 = JCM 21142 TaxID=869213 RepID=W7YDC1_9BACT|nr:family 16 glycosylhydrolase [Saccharicrinis fermentans]GAF05493.1 extracellular agarase precursor [Saccharicrinis fermentans DSM 9555 = JCM 21142]